MNINEFSIPIRVYIEDTDAGGVVYYVNYLKFMERARTEFLREFGIPKPALLTHDLITVVASAQIDYKRSARLDDELLVTATPIKKARSYIVFKQCIWRSKTEQSDSELIAEASIKIACVSKSTMKPSAFPAFLVTALKGVGE